MICLLCEKLIRDDDKKKLMVQGKIFWVHKSCLRKATRKQLSEKGLIKPNDPSFWTKY